MKILELSNIPKLYFGYEDIARVLGISESSARVSASRYVRQGALLRIKRNMYVLREVWNAAAREQKFLLANMGQTPSYISLMTALDYYGITTQVQRDFKVKLGSILENDLRSYYVTNQFSYLEERLASLTNSS